MTFHFTNQFLRDVKVLPQPIRKKLKRQLGILASQGVRYQGLGAKKMVNQEDIWEARIDIHYRFTFQMKDDHVLLRRIGSHEIYRNP